MMKTLPIMVQGTHSDAGKSVFVTALCRIFHQDGYKTAPFKSQNMALNSYITVDGKEIGRAQGVQAEAACVHATTDMNPILIKPSRENESQVVVHGRPYQNMKAAAYRQDFYDQGLEIIQTAYQNLTTEYERIVIEGAGSPAEVNLNDRELVNMKVAQIANTPVILVGDIEKGGVFASLVGTLELLEKEDRDRIIGVVINKFRGDVTLLEPGLKWFEEYTGKKVLGVLPYVHNLNIDAEDSVILQTYTSNKQHEKDIDIAVIRYPMISNFTDIDPFFVEDDVEVRYVRTVKDLGQPDIVILPGSKNTIEDLQFLKDSGLEHAILQLYKKQKTMIIGICGGYQMLGETVEDPHQVETDKEKIDGLSLFSMQTTLTQEKRTVLSEGSTSFQGESFHLQGYEIHMGYSTHTEQAFIRMEEGFEDGAVSSDHKVIGTYFHGIFHNDLFRHTLLNQVRVNKNLIPFESRISYHQLREDAFNKIADHVRAHVDLSYISEKMSEFQMQKERLS